ncbi:esterase AAEL000016-like isoform X1 [Cucurbita moschata]|uniref:Esterase AAEL000016-like isoform X1 n=1 Tax=Cucurbita moschata TaxID=3662 RepID=A0A6J1GGH5_CUCMO|nr:esterase AAEL000016-like isoform X1 [Cucurbita moschata]
MSSFSHPLSSLHLHTASRKPRSPEVNLQRKPRFLCLHGFRTSGEILKKQLGKWPASVLDQLDLQFLDAPFLAQGSSDVERFFDPPYFEWFQFSADFTEHRNLEECLSFIEDYMLNHEPFDGLLGFSQGATLSAALPGLQASGAGLTKVPKIKFVIIVSGAKFNQFLPREAFSTSIGCPSLHFLGERDPMKPRGVKLLESFIDPLVIYHSKGHIVPTLDHEAVKIMQTFIHMISNTSDV